MQRQNDRPLNVHALLESTGTRFTVARYPPRATLFLQGDACESVMYIQKGRVWLAVTAPAGKEVICGVLAAGGFLGDEALAGHAFRRQTATAMTATEVLVVPKAQMIQLLHSQPAIADRFIAHVLERKTRLEADLSDQLLYSTERRLAHTLLVLAGCDERRPCRCALPDVSQEIIAEMVGTTRSRVNLFLGKFKKLGFLEEAGGVFHVAPSLMHLVGDSKRGRATGRPVSDARWTDSAGEEIPRDIASAMRQARRRPRRVEIERPTFR
jgi:CRP/FNR family transcriptional regulator, cyclic AMP receptor protein